MHMDEKPYKLDKKRSGGKDNPKWQIVLDDSVCARPAV